MTTIQRIIKYCSMVFAAFLAVSIIGGILSAFGIFSRFSVKDVEGEMKTYSVNTEIENLDIDISAAKLKIVSGDDFEIKSNHKYLIVTENQGTLGISEKKGVFGFSSGDVKVVLTVPEELLFEKVSISTGAGKLGIEELSSNILNLDLGAGKTEIDVLNVKDHTEINSGTGKLEIKDGELNDLSMDIGVGKMELAGKLTGNCKIDYGIGKAQLNLLGSEDDYRIELDKGVGGAVLNGKAMSDGHVYGDGENRIDIDGGVGSLEIQFE